MKKKLTILVLTLILILVNTSFTFAALVPPHDSFDKYEPFYEKFKVTGIKYSIEGSDEIITETNLKELFMFGHRKIISPSKLYLVNLPYGSIPKDIEIVDSPAEHGIKPGFMGNVFVGKAKGIDGSMDCHDFEEFTEEDYVYGKQFINGDTKLWYTRSLAGTDIITQDNKKMTLLQWLQANPEVIDTSDNTRGYLMFGHISAAKYDKRGKRWIEGFGSDAFIIVQTPAQKPEPEIEIANINAKPGDTVSVPVSIKNNTGFASFSGKPTYDGSVLEFVGYDLASSIMSDAKIEGENISVSADTNKYTGDGQLFTAKFKVKDEAVDGSYEIGWQKECKTADSNVYEIKDAAGKIDVSVPMEMKKDRIAKQVKEYKNAEDYREDEKSQLESIIKDAVAGIKAAADEAAANEIADNAKAEMDKLKTKAVYEAEEAAALKEAKENLKKELKAYKNANDYRDAEKAQLADIISEGEQNIEAAADKEKAKTALEEAKAKMDKLTTKSAYEEKENTELTLAAEKDLNKNSAIRYIDGIPTFIKQESKGLNFRLAEGELDKFISIEVDGSSLDKAHYELKKGSIIATLKSDYLNGLSIGKHNIKIQTKEGYGEASFAVAAKTTNKNNVEKTNMETKQKKSGNVNTGDSRGNMQQALILLGACSLALFVTLAIRKRV